MHPPDLSEPVDRRCSMKAIPSNAPESRDKMSGRFTEGPQTYWEIRLRSSILMDRLQPEMMASVTRQFNIQDIQVMRSLATNGRVSEFKSIRIANRLLSYSSHGPSAITFLFHRNYILVSSAKGLT